ncbi:hypothetical protein ULMA_19770 [Patiriisocius marinus]|uniref:histidine kinase n=1 Tax=Patiriisocius marinus TaxID=1397112 RepID=A0A5J4IQ60_9FLAO|nr:hypothetical protein ULMA_19770 [Patiriisocius marinus]
MRHSVNCQTEDSYLINLSGKQRMLSQSISKVVFSINNSENETSKLNSITSLKIIVEEFENSHKYLVENNKDNSVVVDSLLGVSQIYLNKIVQSSWNIINKPDTINIKDNVAVIAKAESSYLSNMDLLVLAYQKKLDQNLEDLANYINLLALAAFLIIIGQYIFIIAPSFKQLFNRNTDISAVEEELSISKNNQELSKRALSKVNLELKAILNSGPIAIISTDVNGIINHFNHGAELLLGYSASEMVGLNEPEMFHIKEELDNFRIDIAETYGADPEGYDPYLELAKRNLYDTREWTFKRKDGSVFPVQLTLNAIKNSAGEKVGFLGIAFDITERKKAKEELLKKNQLLNFSEVITKTGHWKWDVIADRVRWSDNLYNVFELDKNVIDIQFDTYFKYVHPDDKDFVAERFDDAIKGRGLKSFVHKISTNGKTKTIQILGEITTNEKGEVVEMIGTCQDITEQWMSENKFRGLLESAPDAMIIVDEDGLIQIANKQAEILFGYTSSELIGQSAGILFPKRIAYYFDKYQAKYFGNPKIKSIGVNKDSFGITKDGREIHVQLSLSPLETDEGILVSTAIRDITIQKEAEKELIRKNQLLNFAEKITKMGNWQWDLITNDLYWSTNLCKIFEIDENTDITFETYFDFVHPDDREEVSDQIKESIEGELFNSVIHRIILKSGTIKIIQLLAVVVKNEDGDVLEMIGSCQDITEQRMAENKFRGLLESAPDAMIIVNDKGIIQLVNKQAEYLFGYPAFELVNESVEILIPNRFMENYEIYLTESFGNPKAKVLDLLEKDLYTINKIGEEIPVHISLSPLQTEEGLLVSVAIRDITKQKKAENELLRKNQLLSFAEEITMMGNWQWNLMTNDVKWSANLYRIFGIDSSLEVNFDDYFSFVHQDDKELVTKHIEKSLKINSFESLLHKISLKDGTVKTIQLLAEIILNSEGDAVEMIGTCQDITAQKFTENELIRKNHILNFAEKITLMGNWQADIVNDEVKWSTNLYRIFQLDENTKTTLATYLEFTHPDDKAKVAKHMRDTVEKKVFTDLVHRIQLADGTVKIVQLLAQVVTDDSNNVTEVIGTCQDVTTQRMAENKFRGLLESAPDAMVIVNDLGNIQLINKQAENLFGYTLDEIFNKSVEILIPTRFSNNHSQNRSDFFSNPKIRSMGVGKGQELFGINRDGKEIPIQISLSPLQTEEGLLVSAAIRDITVQKNAELKIIQANENLKLLTKHLSGQNKQLEDFAHISSHNLRSPVSNLNALLHIYNHCETEEEREEVFEKFEIVISHLTSTLNVLIEAIKTKKENIKVLEKISFNDVLVKTKVLISQQIQDTNTMITSDFSEIPIIEYHKTYLESIFLNLVTNAIKYKDPIRHPKIHIESKLVKGKVWLTISDNGLGIDLNKHGHKLFGLNKTFHRHPEAKGVGLYLTKIQVETMGGTIFAKSELGKGSKFTVIFNN